MALCFFLNFTAKSHALLTVGATTLCSCLAVTLQMSLDVGSTPSQGSIGLGWRSPDAPAPLTAGGLAVAVDGAGGVASLGFALQFDAK
jgi:hypothetical protein